MPHIIDPLRIQPLDASLRKDTKLGAEVHLPTSMNLLDIPSLSKIDKETLQQALFAHGVLVIRNQAGLEPKVLVELARLFDPAPLDHHSGGTKQVTDPNNILSLNNCSRIPDAPQVTVIGKGRFEDHQGLSEVTLQHLDHLSFHEKPLSSEAIREGFTRPYRWHMDAPLYENLPGIATVLHAVQVPDLPDQRLAFDDGKELGIAAGATACWSSIPFLHSTKHSHLTCSLLRRTKLRTPQRRAEAIRPAHHSTVRPARLRMDQRLQSHRRRPEHRARRPRESREQSPGL